MKKITLRTILLTLVLCSLAACATRQQRAEIPTPLPGSPAPGSEADIEALTRSIAALGPEVSPEEAARVARISYEHTYQLALQYEITDRALVHNIKVNTGLKPRGLCRHWAEDMDKRLSSENFETLEIHRGIGALVGVDHSTVIVSRRGDSMYDGIVIDPWRDGGNLTWIATDVDTRWGWEPQFSVLDRQAYDLAVELGEDTITYSIEDKPARCLVLADGRPQSREIFSSTNMERCLADQSPGSPLGLEQLLGSTLY